MRALFLCIGNTMGATPGYRKTGDDGQPQWECSADLPADGALGAVTVSCEGYDSPSDPYVLVGSCSLTYSLDAVGPW